MENKLLEQEILRLRMQQEKAARINSELAHIELLKQKLQAEGTQLNVEHQAFFNTIKEKYSLKPEDKIDEHGTIFRKQVEEKKDS